MLGAKRSPLYPVAGTMAPRLTTVDRIYLAIIASAILLLLGAAGLYPTSCRTPERSVPHDLGKRVALAANDDQEPRT